jgi:hypothetical protein
MWRYLPLHRAAVETCVELVSRCPVVCQFVPYAMSHLYCYRKKHKHFDLSHVGGGGGWRMSVVNSVMVAVVVSLGLHHQKCDNFHKMQQENAKWTGDVILYVALHCLFVFLDPPLKACTTPLLGPEGRVHSDADGVWTYSPGPLWKISSSSDAFKENELLDAWLPDVGRSGCMCDTPDSSSQPPSSSELLSLGAPASHLAVPNQFR